ncbi:MAG: GNAT family acetyltransferase [Propionibacteriaceae bacterium]|nr:GNAT family acetyltransferase [Propionibacteriaceae bacterium]
MEIRIFTSADADQVIALWRECGLTRPWNDPRADIDRLVGFQPGLFFVGEDGGAIVAAVLAGYDGHRGSINYLAVSPARRCEGLGAAMLAHAEAALRGLGCPKINLQVRADNRDVVGFYERQGYEIFEVVDLGKRFSA